MLREFRGMMYCLALLMGWTDGLNTGIGMMGNKAVVQIS